MESLLNVAEDVVSSLVSRRAALPPTDVTTGALISEIRERAGTDPSLISTTPSYNEIMLAMTKERFFAPEYFFQMQNNIGTIKQEQANIDAYTTVQLQDIYLLQEQINALLAARAAIKLDTDNAAPQSQATPLRTGP
jgi:hypothetical protein